MANKNQVIGRAKVKVNGQLMATLRLTCRLVSLTNVQGLKPC